MKNYKNFLNKYLVASISIFITNLHASDDIDVFAQQDKILKQAMSPHGPFGKIKEQLNALEKKFDFIKAPNDYVQNKISYLFYNDEYKGLHAGKLPLIITKVNSLGSFSEYHINIYVSDIQKTNTVTVYFDGRYYDLNKEDFSKGKIFSFMEIRKFYKVRICDVKEYPQELVRNNKILGVIVPLEGDNLPSLRTSNMSNGYDKIRKLFKNNDINDDYIGPYLTDVEGNKLPLLLGSADLLPLVVFVSAKQKEKPLKLYRSISDRHPYMASYSYFGRMCYPYGFFFRDIKQYPEEFVKNERPICLIPPNFKNKPFLIEKSDYIDATDEQAKIKLKDLFEGGDILNGKYLGPYPTDNDGNKLPFIISKATNYHEFDARVFIKPTTATVQVKWNKGESTYLKGQTGFCIRFKVNNDPEKNMHIEYCNLKEYPIELTEKKEIMGVVVPPEHISKVEIKRLQRIDKLRRNNILMNNN